MTTDVREERRRTRSEQLVVALRLAFESVAQGFDLSHLVLCDSAGFAFAGIGNEKDVEALAALRPDLVLLAPSSRLIARLGDLGIPTLALPTQTHEDIRQAMKAIGARLGRSEASDGPAHGKR